MNSLKNEGNKTSFFRFKKEEKNKRNIPNCKWKNGIIREGKLDEQINELLNEQSFKRVSKLFSW